MPFGFLKDVIKVGAPIVGGVLGGPLGAGIGLGVSGAIGSAEQQGRANELQNQAIARQQREFAARQPFRDLLMQSLQQQPERQDLSALFASSNPFALPIPPPSPLGVPINPVAPTPTPRPRDPRPAGRGRRQDRREPFDELTEDILL